MTYILFLYGVVVGTILCVALSPLADNYAVRLAMYLAVSVCVASVMDWLRRQVG